MDMVTMQALRDETRQLNCMGSLHVITIFLILILCLLSCQGHHLSAAVDMIHRGNAENSTIEMYGC